MDACIEIQSQTFLSFFIVPMRKVKIRIALTSFILGVGEEGE
jgi:hypothetical protein